MRDRLRFSSLRGFFCVVIGFVGARASAQVDPALVGMWKLSVPGLTMFWQIRADGMYRYFGTSARPLEHWGTIDIGGGKWTTRWAAGKDGGTYTLSGDVWMPTGSTGTSSWQRQWKPGTPGSSSACPLIDVAEVEELVASVVQVRGDATSCDLRASGVGFSDGVKILIVDHAAGRYANVRKQTGATRAVVDVPGLGTAAFIDGDTIRILKGNRMATVEAGLYPAHPDAVSNDALIRLGRSVVTRF
jgi:hypothetical protein